MKLTKVEKKLILERRRQQADNSPKKFGFLKEDLYTIDADLSIPKNYGWIFSESTKNKIIKDFSDHFVLALKAGSQFHCFIRDDKEEWYDCEGYGIECLDNEWAEDHLIDIQPYLR